MSNIGFGDWVRPRRAVVIAVNITVRFAQGDILWNAAGVKVVVGVANVVGEGNDDRRTGRHHRRCSGVGIGHVIMRRDDAERIGRVGIKAGRCERVARDILIGSRVVAGIGNGDGVDDVADIMTDAVDRTRSGIPSDRDRIDSAIDDGKLVRFVIFGRVELCFVDG